VFVASYFLDAIVGRSDDDDEEQRIGHMGGLGTCQSWVTADQRSDAHMSLAAAAAVTAITAVAAIAAASVDVLPTSRARLLFREAVGSQKL